jgi:hypothetical protein
MRHEPVHRTTLRKPQGSFSIRRAMGVLALAPRRLQLSWPRTGNNDGDSKKGSNGLRTTCSAGACNDDTAVVAVMAANLASGALDDAKVTNSAVAEDLESSTMSLSLTSFHGLVETVKFHHQDSLLLAGFQDLFRNAAGQEPVAGAYVAGPATEGCRA